MLSYAQPEDSRGKREAQLRQESSGSFTSETDLRVAALTDPGNKPRPGSLPPLATGSIMPGPRV